MPGIESVKQPGVTQEVVGTRGQTVDILPPEIPIEGEVSVESRDPEVKDRDLRDLEVKPDEKPVEKSKDREETTQEKKDRYVPYDRFHEVIEEKNEARKRLNEAEERAKMYEQMLKERTPAKAEQEAPKLSKEELEERIKNDPVGYLKEMEDRVTAKVQAELQQRDKKLEEVRERVKLDSDLVQMRNKFKDFEELEPEMKKMIPEVIDYIDIGDKRGLTLLYKMAKERTGKSGSETTPETVRSPSERGNVPHVESSKGGPGKPSAVDWNKLSVEEMRKRLPRVGE